MAFALRFAGATAGIGGEAVGGLVTNAASSCFRNFTNGIPHPTECSCIGAICFYLGVHDHRKFNLLIDLHEFEKLPDSSSYYLEIHSGRWTVTSQVIQVKKNTRIVTVEERLLIHVRQVDTGVSFLLYKKGVLRSELFAHLQLKVKEDLIDKHFPKREWYAMEAKKGRVEPRIRMSLYKLDPSLPTGQSPLMQQALLIAQQEADEKGESLHLDLGGMTQKERLAFFSRVLEGPLEKMKESGGSWIQLYFKCLEVKPDRWEWCFWPDKLSCYKNEEKKSGSIPFLAISAVLPDQKDRNVFYVRYHNKQHGQNDVFLRRVDRDRNLWSDGLYEFIERLRTYREVCASRPVEGDKKKTKKGDDPQTSPGEGTSRSSADGRGESSSSSSVSSDKKKSKKTKGKSSSSTTTGGDISPRGSPVSTPRRDISSTRRLNSPRGSALIGEGSASRFHLHTPHARQQMVEEVMLTSTTTTQHSSNEEEEES